MSLLRALLLLAAAVAVATAADAAAWKSRAIYQLLTDRFATTNGDAPGCDKHNYCGGTFQGIINKLDYIQGMGFDAIWISPVLKNSDGGYHGYWASNWFAINEHFGSEQSLRALVNASHARGMYVMIDVVCNHVGYGSITPFNSEQHYHDCNGCPGSCNIENYQNQQQVEHCRLAGLKDLNQENSWVKEQLIKSGKYVLDFGADGLRLDTVPEVSKSYWSEYRQALGTYMVGEVFDGRLDYSAGYQGPIDAVLAYPMRNTLCNVFGSNGNAAQIGDMYRSSKSQYKDVSILGSFLDNHDNSRFLNWQRDAWKFKNALAYTIMGDGIPIVYYGSEQGFAGGNDPENREPLWQSGYNTQSDYYKFVAATVKARKAGTVWNYAQEQVYADQQVYAFTRGQTLVVLTNAGSGSSDITRTFNHPFKSGQKVCNIYWPNDDCQVISGNQITVKLMHGEAKIFQAI